MSKQFSNIKHVFAHGWKDDRKEDFTHVYYEVLDIHGTKVFEFANSTFAKMSLNAFNDIMKQEDEWILQQFEKMQ